MKRINLFSFAFFFSFLLCFQINAYAQSDVSSPFEVAILKADGAPLSQQDRVDEQKTTGPGKGEIAIQFKYKNQPVTYGYKATTGNQGEYYFESPLFMDGSICIGFRFPLEKHLPQYGARSAGPVMLTTFDDKLKTLVTVPIQTQVIAPKPRKKLTILSAEYGANDRWMNVADAVKKLQIGDSLEFRPSNSLFGKDPAPNVPKSIMLTYMLEDEDDEVEELKEYREGSLIQIQFDPKEQYFRLIPKGKDEFKFSIQTGAGK